MTGRSDVSLRRPDLFERLVERLMVWHDPTADRRRDQRYEGVRVRAIETRQRSEHVLGSYTRESGAVRARRRR